MATSMLVAFWCNLAAVLLTGLLGVTYATRRKIMPYHSAALGRSWSDLDPQLQKLLLGLIKGIGGYGIAFVLAQLAVLLIPFRDGASWAHWAVPIAGLVQSGFSFHALRIATRGTPAKPPFVFPLGVAALYLIGLGAPLI